MRLLYLEDILLMILTFPQTSIKESELEGSIRKLRAHWTLHLKIATLILKNGTRSQAAT